MASQQKVKQYLAYWFQLGKKVWIGSKQEAVLPSPVLAGNSYSQAFEDCWQYLISPESGDCHLEGTEQTIAELLSSSWETISCARCDMPVPVKDLGMQSMVCPCYDLPTWPNTALPAPRNPVDSQECLRQIGKRLQFLGKSE